MACAACTIAEKNPGAGHFGANCDECAARGLAGSMVHFEAKRTGKVTPAYQSMLHALFGDDWERGHARVKGWADRMKP